MKKVCTSIRAICRMKIITFLFSSIICHADVGPGDSILAFGQWQSATFSSGYDSTIFVIDSAIIKGNISNYYLSKISSVVDESHIPNVTMPMHQANAEIEISSSVPGTITKCSEKIINSAWLIGPNSTALASADFAYVRQFFIIPVIESTAELDTNDFYMLRCNDTIGVIWRFAQHQYPFWSLVNGEGFDGRFIKYSNISDTVGEILGAVEEKALVWRMANPGGEPFGQLGIEFALSALLLLVTEIDYSQFTNSGDWFSMQIFPPPGITNLINSRLKALAQEKEIAAKKRAVYNTCGRKISQKSKNVHSAKGLYIEEAKMMFR